MADFAQTIATAYAVDGAALDLGRGVLDGAVVPAATVKLPLRMANRHGLIAGATGTGKTKTLQGLAEQLSAAGVPVFVADVKGDLSGIAKPGETGGLAARMAPPAEAATPGGDGAGQARPTPAGQPKEAASALGGGVAAVSAFLQSKEGKQLEKEVMRGVFGLLKKRR